MTVSTNSLLISILPPLAQLRAAVFDRFDGELEWQSHHLLQCIDDATDLVYAVINRPGKSLSFEYVESVAGLQTAAGYCWGAMKEFSLGNNHEGLSLAWQAASYYTMGAARVNLATITSASSDGGFEASGFVTP